MNRFRTFQESKRSLNQEELLNLLNEVDKMPDSEIDKKAKENDVSWVEILCLLIVIIITGGLVFYAML